MADARRSESREGVSITEELARMLDIVVPLIENGLSPEAVWMSNPDLPVGCRTIPVLDGIGHSPHSRDRAARKVRCRPRKKKTWPCGGASWSRVCGFPGAFPRGEGLCSGGGQRHRLCGQSGAHTELTR